MDPRSSLHWCALLLGIFALAWALVSFAGALVVVIPLAAIAGFILGLVNVRRVDTQGRPFVYAGALLGLVTYGLWVVLRLASLPVGFRIGGQTGGTAPPQALGDFADALSGYLATFGAIAAFILFWPLWTMRERIIGGVGASIVTLLQSLALVGIGTGASGAEEAGTMQEILFLVGFLLLAVALALPLFTANDRPAWTSGPA